MDVVFRLIRNVIPAGIIVALYFLGTDVLGFLSMGQMDFAVPLSGLIWLAILGVYFAVETFVFGGPWAAAVYLVLAILILQNWLVAVIVAVLNAGLRFAFGKMGGQ
jgi:hypothetical protein|tara:strand:- start:1660 stop:1977 length:318 start_codon:yes stop_codon:yes gene_type:complete